MADNAFSAAIRDLRDEADRRGRAAVDEIGAAVAAQARRNLTAASHGDGQPHVGGRGGEAPNRVSGRLARAVTQTRLRRTETGWETTVGLTPSGWYGVLLELTGVGRKRTRYPFMLPAFRAVVGGRARAIIDKHFRRPWARGHAGGGR